MISSRPKQTSRLLNVQADECQYFDIKQCMDPYANIGLMERDHYHIIS